MTLNDLERIGRYFRYIEFGGRPTTSKIKMVEARPHYTVCDKNETQRIYFWAVHTHGDCVSPLSFSKTDLPHLPDRETQLSAVIFFLSIRPIIGVM